MTLASGPVRAAEGSAGAPRISLPPHPRPPTSQRRPDRSGGAPGARRPRRRRRRFPALPLRRDPLPPRQLHRSRTRLRGRHRPEPGERPRLVGTGPHRTGPLPRTARPRPLLQGVLRSNHRDTDIILAYADFVTDPASKSILLDNVARLAGLDQPERAERAVAQRQIHQRLAGPPPVAARQPVCRLPAAAHRIPSRHFRAGRHPGLRPDQRRQASAPAARYRSARYPARCPRGPEPRVWKPSSPPSLGGFGDAGAGESRVALARTVAFGDLDLRRMPRRSLRAQPHHRRRWSPWRRCLRALQNRRGCPGRASCN